MLYPTELQAQNRIAFELTSDTKGENYTPEVVLVQVDTAIQAAVAAAPASRKKDGTPDRIRTCDP